MRCGRHASPQKSIRESVEAMRKAAGMGNPLIEASAVGHETRVSPSATAARWSSHSHPATRSLDFDSAPERQLSIVGGAASTHHPTQADVQ